MQPYEDWAILFDSQRLADAIFGDLENSGFMGAISPGPCGIWCRNREVTRQVAKILKNEFKVKFQFNVNSYE